MHCFKHLNNKLICITKSQIQIFNIVKELGIKVSPLAKIEVEGNQVNQVDEKKVTFVFNKPLGVVSSASDDRGRPTVVDFFKNEKLRLYPVGRLDFNTSGCLLITNDGELSNLVTHPSSHLEKVYIVTVFGNITDEALKKLQGMFSLGLLCTDQPQHLIGVRNGSPLIVGIAEEGNFIASDIHALLKLTKKFIYLEDGDIADIYLNKIVKSY